MTNDTYDATLADWIICELSDGGRFLAGKVSRDRKGRFRDGEYIATSLLISAMDTIVDGHVVETMNSRYLLTDRNTVDDALSAKLDAWMKERPTSPTLADVLASGDAELLAAYILGRFRRAAAEAVWSRKSDE